MAFYFCKLLIWEVEEEDKLKGNIVITVNFFANTQFLMAVMMIIFAWVYLWVIVLNQYDFRDAFFPLVSVK
jgi:hypothetical protein